MSTVPPDPETLQAGLSGKELLEAMRRGELPPPPIAAVMVMSIEEVDDGRVVIKADPDGRHLNSYGGVHGGYMATVLDTAMACALGSREAAGVAVITLALNVNYVRPLSPSIGPVLVEGKVVHLGARVATTEGTVRPASTGKLIAHGTSTFLRVASS